MVEIIPNIRIFEQTTNMYNKAICINLARRKDRRKQAEEEFKKFDLKDVEFYPAVDNPKNGMAGLHQTMLNIFGENAGKELLIFEDDVLFGHGCNISRLSFLIKEYSPPVLDVLYLGGNASEKAVRHEHSPFWKVSGGFLTTHAVLYSSFMTAYLAKNMYMPKIVTRQNTYDVFLSNQIQPFFPCYALYPAFAHQRNGHSDICGFSVNYSDFHNRSKKFYE